MKVTVRLLHRDLEQAKKQATDSQSEKKVELGKYLKQIEEKTTRVSLIKKTCLYVYLTCSFFID